MPKGIRANNLPINEIIRLYTKELLTSTTIGKRFDISSHVILRILHEKNVAIRDKNKQRKNHLDPTELRELYINQHLNSLEIAEKLNITFPTVLRFLREYNIPVRGSHDGLSHKNTVKIEELTDLFTNPHYINGKYGRRLVASAKCPVCLKIRGLSRLSRPRIRDIVNSNGRCNLCAMKSRAINIEESQLKELYTNKRLTAKQIGKKFNTSDMTVRKILEEYHIPTRKKGELLQKVIHNKGTVESPHLGDIRRGNDIGLHVPTYYTWVQCPKCKRCRWQGNSHLKRNGAVCYPCAVEPIRNNKGTPERPIVDDIRRGIEIGKNGRFYKWVICPVCNKERWELKGHALKLRLCKVCSLIGENTSTWQGGISFEPYTSDFNKHLKEHIRERDNHSCQMCGKVIISGIKLAIHHVDYNKKNCHPNNLLSLCQNKCHPKTNHRREYWQVYFIELLQKRGIEQTSLIKSHSIESTN